MNNEFDTQINGTIIDKPIFSAKAFTTLIFNVKINDELIYECHAHARRAENLVKSIRKGNKVTVLGTLDNYEEHQKGFTLKSLSVAHVR